MEDREEGNRTLLEHREESVQQFVVFADIEDIGDKVQRAPRILQASCREMRSASHSDTSSQVTHLRLMITVQTPYCCIFIPLHRNESKRWCGPYITTHHR